jgi:hypothetical protein
LRPLIALSQSEGQDLLIQIEMIRMAGHRFSVLPFETFEFYVCFGFLISKFGFVCMYRLSWDIDV